MINCGTAHDHVEPETTCGHAPKRASIRRRNAGNNMQTRNLNNLQLFSARLNSIDASFIARECVQTFLVTPAKNGPYIVNLHRFEAVALLARSSAQQSPDETHSNIIPRFFLSIPHLFAESSSSESDRNLAATKAVGREFVPESVGRQVFRCLTAGAFLCRVICMACGSKVAADSAGSAVSQVRAVWLASASAWRRWQKYAPAEV